MRSTRLSTLGDVSCRASPIRGKIRVCAMENREASPPAAFRLLLSFHSCRITTRLETAHLAKGSSRFQTLARCEPRPPFCCSLRPLLCFLWARSMERKPHSCFSATLKKILRLPLQQDGEMNSLI